MVTINISRIPIDLSFHDRVNQVALYLYPIVGTIGIITYILNICILCSRTILISSCPYYFLTFAFSSLLYICIRCTTQFLRIYLPPVHATFMCVFASVDCYCASSYRKTYRDFSQIYLAKRMIYISTSVIIIYFLFLTHWEQTTNDCNQDSTPMIIFCLSTRVVILYVLLSTAMIVFGILTIRNIHQQ